MRRVLSGTLGDTRAFCWATLRQFERRDRGKVLATPKDFGLDHAETHLLLVVANDTLSHVKWVEEILDKVGEPRDLPPERELRDRIREARNLLATHRDERALYWRLTSQHTPHVVRTYKRLNVSLPSGTIDTEVIAYSPPPGASAEEMEEGYSRVGLVGGLLPLRRVHEAFFKLESDLDDLARIHR